MRDEAPLYYNEKYNFYALSRFDDVARELPTGRPTAPAAAPPLEIISANIEMPPGIILFEDPPLHDLHRRLLSRVFTPRRMEADRADGAASSASRALDPLVGAGGFDFIADLGAHDADAHDRLSARHPRSRTRSDPRPHRRETSNRRRTGPRSRSHANVFDDSYQLFAEYIDWRADHPSDDLMTELLQRRGRGDRRHAPPADAHRGARLHRHDRRRRQRDHHPAHRLHGTAARRAPRPAARTGRRPVPDPGAVEETLRYEAPSPVQARYVAHDVEHYGQTVPEGSSCCCSTVPPTATTGGSPTATATTSTGNDRHLSFG